MKKKIIISAIAALLVVGTASVHAQEDRRNDRYEHDHPGGPGRGGPGPAHAFNDRHDGPGAGPRHDFYRGQRLDNEYRSRQYVVSDWRAHRLNQPPRGYQWVQTGNDYVLVAIASGIIAQLVLGH